MTPEEVKEWRAVHQTARGKRLSQAAAAGIIGVRPLTWAAWERGRRAIPGWLARHLDLIEIGNGGGAAITLYPERPHGNAGRKRVPKVGAA